MKCPHCSSLLELEGDNFTSALALACTECSEFYRPVTGRLEYILECALSLLLEILPQELLTDGQHPTRQS